MTKHNQVYKCNICGNIVEILETGAGELHCCNQAMVLMTEKTSDEGLEKHVPVIEKSGSKIKVTVSTTKHPMEKDHHIQWVELTTKDQVIRKTLKPDQTPIVEFDLNTNDSPIKARAYCNLHGLWSS
ncbi:MAG: desulfoferrodoxin [Patescibacteria group bacterium]|nr:desulfoferrodoxin [Patescibacteria group bacterium]